MLDALRDVESTMFSGKNALLKEVLYSFLDYDLKALVEEEEKKHQQKERDESFAANAEKLIDGIKTRIDRNAVLELATTTEHRQVVPFTGWKSRLKDVISVLRLQIEKQTGIEIPITNNGLGYNNLVYIALILAKLQMLMSDKLGEKLLSFLFY